MMHNCGSHCTHKANPKQWNRGQEFVSRNERGLIQGFLDSVEHVQEMIKWAQRQTVKNPNFNFLDWINNFDWKQEFEDPFLLSFEDQTMPVIMQSQKDSIKDLGFGLRKANIYKERQWRPERGSPPVAVQAALDWVDTEGSKLIVNVSSETRRSINNIVSETIFTGKDPRRIFRDIESQIGLHPRWARAVSRYSDRMFAIHPPEVAEKLVQAYRKKLLKARAKMIARTEIIRARNVGQMQAWNLTAQQGLLDKRFTKRKWISAINSPRTCEICKALDRSSQKNPVSFGQSYMITDPVNLTIQMPPAHPNCRCSQGLVFELPEKKPIPLTQMTPAGLRQVTTAPLEQMAAGTVSTAAIVSPLLDLFDRPPPEVEFDG